MSHRLSCLLALAALSLSACDCKGGQKGPCEGDTPLPGCGNACTVTSTCAPGLFCEEQTCTAQCTPTGNECRANETCNSHGQCVGPDGMPDSGADGNVVTEAGLDGIICNDLNVVADPVRPYIIFIIDRSGSMDVDYRYSPGLDCGTANPECLSRWDSVRAVLLGRDTPPLNGDEGIIEEFQSLAHIGLVQYTALGDSGPVHSSRWPLLIHSSAALNNLGPITSAYGEFVQDVNPPMNGDTPTGEAIWATLCHLDPPYDSGLGCDSLQELDVAETAAAPLPPSAPLLPANRNPDAPIIFVLASDGEPDSSVDPDPDSFTAATARTAQRFVIEATGEARQAGILTHVISVAGGTDTNTHLNEVACEGGTGPDPSGGADQTYQCNNANPPATGGAILATDASLLRTELRNVVMSSIPCSFQLSGTVNDVTLARTSGTVTVNGTPVTLDMNNGWWLLDDGRTFTLNGSACGNFRMNPGSSLNASFPCDSGVIIID